MGNKALALPHFDRKEVIGSEHVPMRLEKSRWCQSTALAPKTELTRLRKMPRIEPPIMSLMTPGCQTSGVPLGFKLSPEYEGAPRGQSFSRCLLSPRGGRSPSS